jgi:hypothetical protein
MPGKRLRLVAQALETSSSSEDDEKSQTEESEAQESPKKRRRLRLTQRGLAVNTKTSSSSSSSSSSSMKHGLRGHTPTKQQAQRKGALEDLRAAREGKGGRNQQSQVLTREELEELDDLGGGVAAIKHRVKLLGNAKDQKYVKEYLAERQALIDRRNAITFSSDPEDEESTASDIGQSGSSSSSSSSEDVTSKKSKERKKKKKKGGRGQFVSDDGRLARGKVIHLRNAPMYRSRLANENMDDFVVQSDEEEEEEEDNNARESSNDDQEDNSSDAGMVLPRKQLPMDKAFGVWVRYMMCSLHSPELGEWVHTSQVGKREMQNVIEQVEQHLADRRERWVRSAHWVRFPSMHESMAALPRLSIKERDAGTCDACGKDRPTLTALDFNGVWYSPTHLQFPFAPRAIFGRESVKSNTFTRRRLKFHVGSACLRRVLLYHALLHYKWHAVLELKVVVLALERKAGSAGTLDAIDAHLASSKGRSMVKGLYRLWTKLHGLAENYTAVAREDDVRWDTSLVEKLHNKWTSKHCKASAITTPLGLFPPTTEEALLEVVSRKKKGKKEKKKIRRQSSSSSSDSSSSSSSSSDSSSASSSSAGEDEEMDVDVDKVSAAFDHKRQAGEGGVQSSAALARLQPKLEHEDLDKSDRPWLYPDNVLLEYDSLGKLGKLVFLKKLCPRLTQSQLSILAPGYTKPTTTG